jgi:hypothetical protein
MRSFLTHAAFGLASSAFAIALSFGWVQPDGRTYQTSVFAQNSVIAMLAVAVSILAYLQIRSLTRERSRPRMPARQGDHPPIGG